VEIVAEGNSAVNPHAPPTSRRKRPTGGDDARTQAGRFGSLLSLFDRLGIVVGDLPGQLGMRLCVHFGTAHGT